MISFFIWNTHKDTRNYYTIFQLALSKLPASYNWSCCAQIGRVEWIKFHTGGISTLLVDYTCCVLNSELLLSYLEQENPHALEIPM